MLGMACGAVVIAGPLLMVSSVAATAADTPPLSVVGGEGARTLVLRVCTANAKRSRTTAEALANESCRSVEKNDGSGKVTVEPAPVLVGSLTLDVTNTSSKPKKVTVYYRRSDGATAELPGPIPTYTWPWPAHRGAARSRSRGT